MARKRFAFAGGQRLARVCAGLLLTAGLALGLTARAACARQVAESRKADPETREKIAEALEAFGELLAVSRNADAIGSHHQVREESWRDAQAAWERSSATLPPPVKSLKRCAVPLAAARGMIERADDLFRRARDNSNPFDAARMLAQHERLLKQAEGRLQRAERCYGAVRKGYSEGREVDSRSHGKMSVGP